MTIRDNRTRRGEIMITQEELDLIIELFKASKDNKVYTKQGSFVQALCLIVKHQSHGATYSAALVRNCYNVFTSQVSYEASYRALDEKEGKVFDWNWPHSEAAREASWQATMGVTSKALYRAFEVAANVLNKT
jgi:hypothetical protein